jgi:hypothetical protein
MDLQTNQITVFKNAKKTAENKQPDYTGKLNIDGVVKDVSLWIRESKNGGKFLSGQIKDEWKPNKSEDASSFQNKGVTPENDDPF